MFPSSVYSPSICHLTVLTNTQHLSRRGAAKLKTHLFDFTPKFLIYLILPRFFKTRSFVIKLQCHFSSHSPVILHRPPPFFSPGAAPDLVPITTAEAEGQGPRKDYLQKGSHISMLGFVSQYISSERPLLWLESGHPFKKCPFHKNIRNFFH